MHEILTLFLIGLALSMDAFSLALALGTFNVCRKKQFILAVTVGVMHCCLPLLGMSVGRSLVGILNISANLLFSAILLLIAFEMLRNVIIPSDKKWVLNFWGILTFAFSVSFDSFSVGLGLSFVTTKIIFAVLIFAFLSFLFTLMGLSIGKYAKKHLGVFSNVIGTVLLVVTAIINLCK